MTDELRLKIENLPDSPGCYLMKQQGEIIYVGKAVNLKNRVRSYFQSSRGHTVKVAAMVGKIDDFDIMLCSTNLEALILECNLIKRHKPYYNILLKDDKHYPYVRVDMQKPFPRLEVARRIEKDGAKYFGPYIGATVVRQVMDSVQNIFPLRNCTLDLPLKSPRRPCVQYEIGRCLAPCAEKCSREEYAAMMEQVLSFLGGRYQDVVSRLKADMAAAARDLNFEKAAVIRDRIRDVELLMERQQAIQVSGADQDVLAVAQDGLDAMAQVLYVRGGRMIGGDHFALPGAGNDPKGEVMEAFLTQYYEDGNLIPRQVLCEELAEGREELEAWLRDSRGSAVTLATPKRGEKHDLVLLAQKNAQDALEKRNARAAVKQERTTGAAAALGEALGLPQAPRRIEGFDISNTQGAQSVASMVVFLGGEPARKEYRHFRIRTVEGANDFASMNEVLGRRFRHGLEEIKEREAQGLAPEGGRFSYFPDLVLIDGGPEQLAFARRAMLESGAEVPMFGLAKRLEEIYLPDREYPILLDRHSPALHLIQHIRDEAHRFAITHHRALRGKESIHSQLSDIPQIGPARQKALIKQFKTLQAIKAATLEELLAVPGMSRPAAEAVLNWANPKE